MSALNQYLAASRAGLDTGPVDLLVMGNEAADLDSMASAIAYAYHLSALEKGKTVIPVMPIPREDFRLRTEAAYVFKQAGIDLDNLLFSDDTDLLSLLARAKGLVLVDHNKLSDAYSQFGHKIWAILAGEK